MTMPFCAPVPPQIRQRVKDEAVACASALRGAGTDCAPQLDRKPLIWKKRRFVFRRRNAVLTVEEVSALPLFAKLPSQELERVASTAADIRLGAGEFAVHEGGEAALFAVLSGRIEVVKKFDGVERTLGWRGPGTIFGEVPLALGTGFPGAYRASEPSRVLRLEPQHYYMLASASREFAGQVSALARERLGGLQSLNSEPQKPRVVLVGHRWDTVCGDLRRFLARNQISFNWLTPEQPAASPSSYEARA